MSLALKNKDRNGLNALYTYLQEAMQKGKGKVTIQASGQEKSLEISEAVLKAFFQQQMGSDENTAIKSVSIKEAGEILGLREEVVKRLIKNKEIPVIDVKGESRISAEKLEKFKVKMLKERRENMIKLSQLSQEIGLEY
jgi:excisionase family DNA binding protein